MIIDVQDEILRLNSLGLLKRLLVDKSSKTNILWGSKAYESLGERYLRDSPITPDLITGAASSVIKNRARKELEQKAQRSKTHAEIFTSSWICEKLNNWADETWFGYKNLSDGKNNILNSMEFSKSKDWKKYVDSRRLEITCGEAPFLVTRYDVYSGEYIPVKDRVGQLDRKLNIVNKNATSEEEWLKWSLRAFQASYGYDCQGDNVLIARVNLLLTFEEFLGEKWHRRPTFKEYCKYSNIIAWNIWQMDGLTGKIPASNLKQGVQLDLYKKEEIQKRNNDRICKIYDWRSKKSVSFLSMKGMDDLLI